MNIHTYAHTYKLFVAVEFKRKKNSPLPPLTSVPDAVHQLFLFKERTACIKKPLPVIYKFCSAP